MEVLVMYKFKYVFVLLSIVFLSCNEKPKDQNNAWDPGSGNFWGFLFAVYQPYSYNYYYFYSNKAVLLNSGKVLFLRYYNYSSYKDILYDPWTGIFKNSSASRTISSSNSFDTATPLLNGKVLVTQYSSAGAELYDPTSDTYTATGSMNNSSSNRVATLLKNGKVLITDVAGSSSSSKVAELYDPDTGTFSTTGSINASYRYGNTQTLLSNGKVLIAGYGYYYNTSAIYSATELYDPDTETFSYTGDMGTTRQDHTATLLPDGKVLIVGGYYSSSYYSTAELYDPSTGTFSNTGSMTTARQNHSATLLPSGKVLIAGGYNGSSLSSTEIYDPSTGTFSSGPDMPFTNSSSYYSRSNILSILLPTGKVLFTPSSSGSGSSSNSIYLYDPDTSSWETVSIDKIYD